MGDPFNIIHFSAKNRDGLNTKKYYYKSKFKELKSITGDFKIKGFTHGALIQFEENTFSNKTAKINILKKDTTLSYDTQRISQNILTTKIINYSDFSDASEIEIIYNTNPKINIKKRFYSAVFYPDQSLYLTKDNFIVNTITNFSNDSTLIWISDSNIEKPKKSKLLSGPYSISPQTLVFKNKLNIGFEYEDLDVGVGIYYYNNKKNNWSYLKTNYNNGMYSTSILSNEVFCLLKEKNPPEIKNLIPDINATYRAQDIEELTFEVEDDLSGISQIENISVKIDSLAVLFEYNPYRKKVFYKFEEELEKGPHLLEIKAKDNVGNVTSINGNFIIK